LQNSIKLEKEISRVYFSCTICDIPQTILFDPGSPNTVITTFLKNQLNLPSSGDRTTLNISNEKITVDPVILPTLAMGNLTLNNVKVYAGLTTNKWRDIVILGLNVLNQLIYTVDRSDDSGFISIELSQKAAIFCTTIFNRLIGKKGYYLTDSENE